MNLLNQFGSSVEGVADGARCPAAAIQGFYHHFVGAVEGIVRILGAVDARHLDRLDQSIGRVVAYLKEQGKLDNMLVMFCSDNGACPIKRNKGKSKRPWEADSYWTYDTGWAPAGNLHFLRR